MGPEAMRAATGRDHEGWRELLAEAGLNLGSAQIRIGNEADYAALTVAQDRPGRPSGLDDFVYLSGDVGIGGALVAGGKVMRFGSGRPSRKPWT